MTKPLYFYNGSTFELVGPTTPQSPIAYQTSAPTAPATGDIWIDSDGDVDTYNRQLTRYYFVATASQTTITGADANGLTLAYVAGSEAVYVNGALQVRGQDYTATNGTSVVMSSGLAVNDVVEIFAYTAFTVANAYTKSETDGIAAAAAGLRMVVPTSVAVGSGSGSVSANGAVTFSGASSISINGCFNSTYDNYKLVFYCNAASATTNIQFRFRTTSDDTGTNYYAASDGVNWSNSGVNSNAITQSSFTVTRAVINDPGYTSFNYDCIRPNVGTYSTLLGGQSMGIVGGPAHNHGAFWSVTATQFTGFTIYPASGNIGGTLRVYGYKN